MSLDVTLITDEVITHKGSGIFVRRDGTQVEVTRKEWDALNPGREPVMFFPRSENVYSDNITHNLGEMAREAQVYGYLWRPDELGITKAKELVAPLCQALVFLGADPQRFKALNPPNGWGDYDGLVGFICRYLEACIKNPEAKVSVSR